MVWAVLMSDALPQRGFGPDRVTVECGPSGIWLQEIGGRTLASLWREQWWSPPTVRTVEAIVASLVYQLDGAEEPIAAGRIEAAGGTLAVPRSAA